MKIYAIYFVDSGRFCGVSMTGDVGAGFLAKLVDVDLPEILPPPIEATPEPATA
jgi:hypothetical protein